jgi:hypothetical protein
MGYIAVPNLPVEPVGLAVVDGRISSEAEQTFSQLKIELIKTCRYPGIYEAISYHPDIMLHHVGCDRIVHAPGVNVELLRTLNSHGFKLILVDSEL